MPATLDYPRRKRSRILAIAGRHGATNLRVFGSVARGKANPESDLDIQEAIDEIGRYAVRGWEAFLQDELPPVLPSASVLPAEAQPSARVVFAGNSLACFTVAGSTTAPPAGFTVR